MSLQGRASTPRRQPCLQPIHSAAKKPSPDLRANSRVGAQLKQVGNCHGRSEVNDDPTNRSLPRTYTPSPLRRNSPTVQPGPIDAIMMRTLSVREKDRPVCLRLIFANKSFTRSEERRVGKE